MWNDVLPKPANKIVRTGMAANANYPIAAAMALLLRFKNEVNAIQGNFNERRRKRQPYLLLQKFVDGSAPNLRWQAIPLTNFIL